MMSLDVSLTFPGAQPESPAVPHIFIREGGQTKEVSREEWDKRFPGREPFTTSSLNETGEVYSANITHNLGKMADHAGLYKPCWRPEEHDITDARQLIEPLRAGLAVLREKPEFFKTFNPDNGWGTYEGLCEFVNEYLQACERYPQAKVSVWR